MIGELFDGQTTGVKPARADHRVRPDILADGDADAIARVLDDRGRRRGLEVAILVEDVIGGQEAFSPDCTHLLAVTKCRRVEERPTPPARVEFNRADDGGHGTDIGRNLGQRFRDIGHEAALEQQVARRITADGELGEDDELGALRDERRVVFENLSPVAG